MKKNKTPIIILMIVFCLGFIGFSVFKQHNSELSQNLFAQVEDKIYVCYKIYGDNPSDTLLMVTNNNSVDVHIQGTVNKWDENGVESNDPDYLDFDVAAHKTYVMPAVNPNNSAARKARSTFKSEIENLEVTPVDSESSDSDSASCLQDELSIKLFPDKRNDQSQALISFDNKSMNDLSIDGYVIFYADEEKTQIQSIVQMSFDSIPANSTYRTYLTIPQDTEVYETYVNECEIA